MVKTGQAKLKLHPLSLVFSGVCQRQAFPSTEMEHAESGLCIARSAAM